jgi:hypothetical protein
MPSVNREDLPTNSIRLPLTTHRFCYPIILLCPRLSKRSIFETKNSTKSSTNFFCLPGQLDAQSEVTHISLEVPYTHSPDTCHINAGNSGQLAVVKMGYFQFATILKVTDTIPGLVRSFILIGQHALSNKQDTQHYKPVLMSCLSVLSERAFRCEILNMAQCPMPATVQFMFYTVQLRALQSISEMSTN